MKPIYILLFITSLLIVSCSPNTSSNPGDLLGSTPVLTKRSTEVQNQSLEAPILLGRPVSVDKGDWDSFGAPIMPPEPIEISGTYNCSAFLQDQVQRSAKLCKDCDEVDFRLYRLYQFEVSETNKRVDFKDLEFRKIAYFGLYSELEHEQLEVEEDIQLLQPKVDLTFSITQDILQNGAPLVLNVGSIVGQQVGDKIVLKYDEHEISSEYGGGFSSSLSVRNSNGEYDAQIPQLFLEVQCRKN